MSCFDKYLLNRKGVEMEMKKHFLSALILFLISQFTFAVDSQVIQFDGQAEDFLKLKTFKTETRFRERVIQRTCTRKVPYQDRECGYETRHRRECRYEPGRNVCETRYERVCRNETRYRRECSARPGSQRCHMTRPQRICRNGRCRVEPPRRICQDGPPRQVCNNVPYTERVCNQEPRQSCHTTPGENICSNVPYQEYVCNDVTRYRNETYACNETIQEPYEFEKPVVANIDVKYSGATNTADSAFVFSLFEDGEVKVSASDYSSQEKLISFSKDLSLVEKPNKSVVSGEINFKFFNKERVLSPVSREIRNVTLNQQLTAFSIGKVFHPKKLRVRLKIENNGPRREIVFLDKELSEDEFVIVEKPNQSRIRVDLDALGVELRGRKFKVKVDISLDYKNEFMNLDSEQELSKSTEVDLVL